MPIRARSSIVLALALVASIAAASAGPSASPAEDALHVTEGLTATYLVQVERDERWIDAPPAAGDRPTSTLHGVTVTRETRLYPDEAIVIWRGHATDGDSHRVRVGLSVPAAPLRGADCAAWVFYSRAGQQMDFRLTAPGDLPPPLNDERAQNINSGLRSLVCAGETPFRADLDSDPDGRWQLYWEEDQLRLLSLHWSVRPDRPLVAVARLRTGEAASGAPRPHDLAALADRPFTTTAWMSERGLYFADDPVELRLHSIALQSLAQPIEATMTLTDWRGERISRRQVRLLDRGEREETARIELEPPRLGMYRVRIDAAGLQREVTFGVVRPPQKVETDRSVFGIHANLRNPHFPRLAEQMGLCWNRLWGGNISGATIWRYVEPEPGRYVWRDDEVALARQHGLRILGMLGGQVPNWVAGGPEAWSDEDFAAWRRYVAATVDHYRDQITHWEVWNEPYGGLRPDQAHVYVRLLRDAWRAAKQVNPSAVIIGTCGPPSAGSWYRPVFEAGGLQYQDAVSAHLYPPAGGEAALDFDEELREQIAGIRELMREFGEEKPLWDTEAGLTPAAPFNRLIRPRYFSTFGRPVPTDIAAAMAARLYIVHAAEDVPLFYYLLHGSFEYAYALCESDGSPLPAAASIATAQSLIDGARPAGTAEYGPVRCYAFTRGTDAILALWGVGLEGRRPVLDLAIRPRATLGIMGNSVGATDPSGHLHTILTPEPLYVLVQADDLPDALEAVRSGPPPQMATLGARLAGVNEPPVGEALSAEVRSFEPGPVEFSASIDALPEGWSLSPEYGYGAQREYVLHGRRTLLFPLALSEAAPRVGEVTLLLRRGEEQISVTDRVELPAEPSPPGRPHEPGIEMAHTGIRHTSSHQWTLVSSTSGLSSLYHGAEPLLEGFYFYVARHGLNQALVGFRGSERETREDPDGAVVVLRNETAHGRCMLTARASREEVTLRWELHVEPIPTGWGELGVYIPEAALNDGYPCRLEAIVGGRSRELTLSAESPLEQLTRVDRLRFEHPRGQWSIDLQGQDFAGSQGWHFQDYRDRARDPGRYRVVLSYTAEEGFDASIVMTIRHSDG